MKYKSNKSILKMSAIILLTIDLFFYLLALKSLYVFSLRVSIYLLIFVLHFIYLYIVLITVSKTKESKVFWGVIGPFFIVPIAIVGWFIFFYNNKVDYYYLSSPNSTQKLIIGYSNWGLGEKTTKSRISSCRDTKYGYERFKCFRSSWCTMGKWTNSNFYISISK